MTAVLLAEPPDDPYAELRRDVAVLLSDAPRVVECSSPLWPAP